MAKQPDYSNLLEIISGRRSGLVAGMVRFGLSLLTPFYRVAIWYRNYGFDSGRRTVNKVKVPVISIGNLTTGGTGKTPFVIWLAQWIREFELDGSTSDNIRVAIISRGYGADETGKNDEAIEIEKRLPNVPHLQGADRFEKAQTAVDDLNMQIILLDDAFQHRQLLRSIDVVLVDAIEPFGFGRLLPRGLLREPVKNIDRADAVVLTRSNLVSSERQMEIRDQIKKLNQHAVWCETLAKPTMWIQANGETASLSELVNQRLHVVCAIGNPLGFRQTLEQGGYRVSGFQTFPDHHVFSRQDLESVAAEAQRARCDAIVCTAKDLVKIEANHLGELPLWALQIEIEFLSGQDDFQTLVRQKVISKISQ